MHFQLFSLSDTIRASIYAVLAYAAFALSDAFGKWLQEEGFNKHFILFITQIPSLILLSGYMFTKYGWNQTFKPHLVKWHILRALCIVSLTLCLFLAIEELPLADLYGIIFCAPFLIAVGARLFFKEHQTKTEWVAIIVGFSGILFISGIDFSTMSIAYLFAFGQALSVAGGSLLVRKIGREEHPFVFVIYAAIAVMIVNAYPMIGKDLPEFNIMHIFIFTVYSITIPLAILFLTSAFTTAPRISAVLPYQYTQIVWGVAIGYFIFNTILGWNVIIGAGIIVVCGLYLIHHQTRNKIKNIK
jgi:S-adenosylmethionine uptake transporter